MPDDSSNEYVVVVQDPSSATADATATATADPSGSEPEVVEVFEAILDPLGTDDPSANGTGPEEVILVDPVDTAATEVEGAATGTADPTDAPADGTATAETIPDGTEDFNASGIDDFNSQQNDSADATLADSTAIDSTDWLGGNTDASGSNAGTGDVDTDPTQADATADTTAD